MTACVARSTAALCSDVGRSEETVLSRQLAFAQRQPALTNGQQRLGRLDLPLQACDLRNHPHFLGLGLLELEPEILLINREQ